MPSIATVILRARDEASDDIRRVATNLRTLDRAATGETIKLDTGGRRGVGRGSGVGDSRRAVPGDTAPFASGRSLVDDATA